jgi:hypothetical protein
MALKNRPLKIELKIDQIFSIRYAACKIKLYDRLFPIIRNYFDNISGHVSGGIGTDEKNPEAKIS